MFLFTECCILGNQGFCGNWMARLADTGQVIAAVQQTPPLQLAPHKNDDLHAHTREKESREREREYE